MQFQPLVGKQLDSVNAAHARINLWEGSVRSSKTISSLIKWLSFVLSGPTGNLLMVGKTERTLIRNILHPLSELLPRQAFRMVQGSGECFIYGRRIYLAGANDERSSDRIRGMTLAGAYVDEVSVVPESFWTMLLSRLSVDGAQVFGTTNPESPRHWLKTKYLDRAGTWLKHDGTIEHRPDGLNLARFSFRLADNPTLSPGYVADLRNEYTGLWARRLIDGEWVLAEGSIYDMFDTELRGPHVVDVLPEFDRFWLGIDYGTTNPFSAILIAQSTEDVPRLYAAREWRWDSNVEHRQLTDAEYSTKLRQWLSELGQLGLAETMGATLETLVDRIYVDPSAASFSTQLYRDGWVGVHHADNAVDDGIRAVSTLLNSDRLKIHVSCQALISEMAGYSWDPKAQAKGIDKPLKVNDHGCDSLRYALWSRRRVWSSWVSSNAELER